MRANMSGRDFCDVLLSIFIHHISAYMRESKKENLAQGHVTRDTSNAFAHAKC